MGFRHLDGLWLCKGFWDMSRLAFALVDFRVHALGVRLLAVDVSGGNQKLNGLLLDSCGDWNLLRWVD